MESRNLREANMAYFQPPTKAAFYDHHHLLPNAPLISFSCSAFLNCYHPRTNFLIHPFLHRPNRCSSSAKCKATSPGLPPPPESDPPTGKGIVTTFHRFKDTVQIFLAVLFWMGLFFWASAWDRGNNDPDKRSRFRR